MSDKRVAVEVSELIKSIGGDICNTTISVKMGTPYYESTKYDGTLVITQYIDGGDAKYVAFDLRDLDEILGFLNLVKKEALEIRQRGFPEKTITE